MSSSVKEAFVPKTWRALQSVNWYLAASLVIALIAAWPLFSDPGFLNTRGGGDSPFLLQRVHQLSTALADGHFPVRWMPDANYGFGYPFFNYYAPLSIYIAAVPNLLGVGPVLAIKLTQLLGFIAAAWAMFSLGKRWFRSDWAGLLTSVVYTLAPFHMVNIYVRGDSMSEFWAMAFFPLTIYFLDSLNRDAAAGDKRRAARSGLFLALCYAALILSHNISALIFTPFLLLYALLVIAFPTKQADREEPQPIKRGVRLIWITGAILFGLGLSAWFWLPALAEQSFAQLGPVTSGYFHFENHFRGFDLVQFDPIFNYDVAAGKSFSMGLFQAVIAAAGLIIIIYYWWRHRRSAADSESNENLPPVASILFIVISLIVASVMITALSRQLWENLPLLKFTQFPWRFLSVQAFAGALASGGLALLPWRRFIIPLILIPYLVVSILGLQLDFLAIGKNEITAENLAQYEWFTGNIGSTVSAEYLPQTVDPRPFTSAWLHEGNRDFVQIIEGEAGSVSNQERHTVHQTWSVEVTTQSAVVLFPTIYWPGWEASIDGVEAPISAAPGSGLILMEIPSGQHQIEFDLARTSIRWAADAMGLIFAAAAVVLFIWSARSAYRWRKLIACVLAAVLILLIFWLFPERTYPESDQSWDFLQLAYLNHSPEGIEFSDGAVLDSYSYSSSNVTPGDMLSINLVWEEQPHEEITIDLVSPAANRHSDAPIVASITISGLSIKNAAVLELPSNSPAGLYLPRLTIEGSSALTESGEKRGDLFLRPILIQDIAETVSGSIHALDARTVSVQDVNEDTLEVQLQWLTKVALTKNLNYSLRLVDSAGIQVAQVDSQPGYGYLPSSQWRSDQWIDDWIALPLPPDPGEDFYSLVVRLYDPGTGQVELIRRLGEITWSNGDIFYTESTPSFSIPSAEHEVEITFGEQISLLGYDLDQSGQYMTLKVYWRALVDGLENYYRFIHLVDPSSGEIIAQSDSMPRFDTYPTSQWVKGEVIEDNVVIDLSDIPAGTYQLALGWYSQSTDPSCPGCTTRLAAADHEGRQLPEDSYQFTIGIPIEG